MTTTLNCAICTICPLGEREKTDQVVIFFFASGQFEEALEDHPSTEPVTM
jgi:hypothetical protein